MNDQSSLNGDQITQNMALNNKKKIIIIGVVLWVVVIATVITVLRFTQFFSTTKETSVSFSAIEDNGIHLILTSEDVSTPFKINEYAEYDPDLAQKISHRSANELYKVKYKTFSRRSSNSGYYWIVSLVASDGVELVSEKESSLPSRVNWPSFLVTGAAALLVLPIAVLKARKSGEERKNALHDLLHKKGWGKPKE